MQRAAARLRVALCATLALLLLTLAPQGANASIPWTPCANTNDFACAQLAVPVQPGTSGGEALELQMRRHLAPIGEAKEAVIALAGGPGQAALPFASEFDALLGPILSTRDLIVFDQRGTGRSHPLSCAAFEHLGNREPSPTEVSVCADQIGAARGFFQTADTVADIEAIRQAGDYEKLVLYGTSYGTKVAERYAQRYPSHVSALVLDSVVTPNGPDPLRRSTFAAIRRVLRSACAARSCAHITADPVRDVARLVRVMRRHPLRGRAFDAHGHAHTVQASPLDLIGVLFDGDFNPLLRAEFPAAIHSALQGDTAALARMVARAEREGEEEPSEHESPSEGFDAPLYFATTCEEQDLPFNRAASPATRRQEALAFLRKLPASTFAPFTHAQALQISDIGVCSQWPYATAGAELDETPLPAVPTLIFSGEDDIRTPTADARQLAAQIPGARLIVVSHTGHSTLGAALGGCPRRALQAFFASKPIRPCDSLLAQPLIRPVPLAPRRLRLVAPAAGTHGRDGRVLHAVLLTLEDFAREGALGIIPELHVPKLLLSLFEFKIGGLRGGWAALSEGTLKLHRYVYVPGVAVSGRIGSGRGVLHISGRAGVTGTLRFAKGTLGGVLDGRPIRSSQRFSLL